MGNKDIGRLFLDYFNSNYELAKNKIAKQIADMKFKSKAKYHYDDDECFQNCILSGYESIIKNGFTFNSGIKLSGYSFMNFMFINVRNEYFKYVKSQGRLVRDLHDVDYNDDDIIFTPEVFIYHEQLEQDIINEHIAEDKLIEDIFKWADVNFVPIEAELFKFKYKTNLTYDQMAIISQYSRSFIHARVRKVKEAVEKHFNTNLQDEENNKTINKRR